MADLVCDTSVLIALHQAELLDILPALSTTVIVPPAVKAELAKGRAQGYDAPDVAAIGWVAVRTPAARPALPDSNSLHLGESEVLWLALESPGSVAVLDELPARRVARQLGIRLTGTLGLLVDAKHHGLIPAVVPVLDALEHHSFHISPRLRALVAKAAGEWGP